MPRRLFTREAAPIEQQKPPAHISSQHLIHALYTTCRVSASCRSSRPLQHAEGFSQGRHGNIIELALSPMARHFDSKARARAALIMPRLRMPRAPHWRVFTASIFAFPIIFEERAGLSRCLKTKPTEIYIRWPLFARAYNACSKTMQRPAPIPSACRTRCTQFDVGRFCFLVLDTRFPRQEGIACLTAKTLTRAARAAEAFAVPDVQPRKPLATIGQHDNTATMPLALQ